MSPVLRMSCLRIEPIGNRLLILPGRLAPAADEAGIIGYRLAQTPTQEIRERAHIDAFALDQASARSNVSPDPGSRSLKLWPVLRNG